MWDEARHSIQGDLTRHPRVPVRPQVTELHYDKSNGSNRPTVAYLTFPGHDSGLNTPSAVKSISAWYVHAAGAHSYTVSHPLLFFVYSNFQNILFCKDFNLIGVWQFWLRELYAFTQAHQFCFEWTCVKYFNSLLMRETGNVAASSKIRNMEMNLQMNTKLAYSTKGEGSQLHLHLTEFMYKNYFASLRWLTSF